jgi:hypothetical protein
LYPELAVLGIHEGQTAALVEVVGRQSTLLPSYEHARRELQQRGLDLSVKEVHRLATRLGAQALTRRKRDLLGYRAGQLPAGSALAGKRVVACIDAGKTRLRRVTRRQKGKGCSKQQRRRYRAEWRDVKLLIIYEIDAHGVKVRDSRPWIDGTFAGPDEALELLAFHLHRLGAAAAEVVVLSGDGAPWIWERLPWVVQRVGLRERQWVFVLDFWHAAHHISLALEKMGVIEPERRQLYRKLRKWMQRGKAWEMIQELRRLAKERRALTKVRTELAYLERHEDACHMDYASYRKRGLPLGSGAVESAVRRVINLRLKGPGLTWYEENAEGMVVLRAAALCERWEELLQSIRAGLSQDGRIDIQWQGPDMRAELKGEVSIGPPKPQVQSHQQPQRAAA